MGDMRGARFNILALLVCGIAWVAIVINSSINARENPNSGREPIAAPEEVARFARATLNDVQARSFSEDTEFCGLIFEDDDGNLSASPISQGREAECNLPWLLPIGTYAVATFHTHGAYDERFDSEVPSVLDMEADIGERIDGFVSTPGGRLWKIEWEDAAASQVCGERCIEHDPDYRPDRGDALPSRITLDQLKRRQAD